MKIVTDVDLALWLSLQRPEYVELFAQICDRRARENDELSGTEIFAGTARALLRGEHPLVAQRRLAECDPEYYEKDVGKDKPDG